MKREKTHAEVMETAGLLMEVAKAFEKLGEAAERIAHGGEAKMDLTPGGSLGRLAVRSRKSAGESGDGESWPDPLAEFPRALEALRELAQDGTSAATEGEAGRLFQDEFDRSRDGGWGLLASPRQVVAWRLMADCRAGRSVAFVLMSAELGMDGLRGWCTGRVTEAEEKVADAEAAMHGALAEKWEAIADLHKPGSKARATAEKSAADERRKKREAEAKAAELKEQNEGWKGAGERLVEISKRREEDLMRERDREAATAAQLAHALHEAEGRKRLLDDAILEIADAKTRKKIQAKRTLKEQGLTRKDRDLQTVFHSIDEEMNAQAKRGEKVNKRKAARAVLSRPDCKRGLEDLDSIYRQYNRDKRRRRRRKQDRDSRQ